jgi:hypothetical protein
MIVEPREFEGLEAIKLIHIGAIMDLVAISLGIMF